MTDFQARFRTVDDLPAPDLWGDVETRALAMSAAPTSGPAWLLIGLAAVLMIGIGSAVLIGSGLVELPVLPEPSQTESQLPSPTADASPSPSESSVPSLDQNATPTWTFTGSNVEDHNAHTATLLPDGTVLVVGGFAGPGPVIASAELYDPVTATWTATEAMAQARAWHSATLLPDGRVLVAGGTADTSAPARSITSAELYDPGTGTWTAADEMTLARALHTATLLPDGRVLVAGGSEWTDGPSVAPPYSRLDSAELYNPATGTWTATGDLIQARDSHTATLLPSGLVLAAGGFGLDRLASAELYDSVTGKWTATGSLPEPYGGHTATLLLDGTVLVAGGDAPRGPEAAGWPHASLYDPLSGTWTATGSMVVAPLRHTATLLPDGRVLVSGGTDYGGQSPVFRDAELYEPVTGIWTATANMGWRRDAHTATLLPDGTVLVSGGTDHRSRAEVYDPAGGT